MWNELQFLAVTYPDISPSTILGLGTRMGARALGRIAECGTLSAGKRADAAVVELSDPAFQDPLRDLFAPGNRIANTMVGGEWMKVES